VINIPLLLDRLCYRYPSMLVDRITEHDDGRLVAVKNVTVSLAGGRWLVSIQTEREVEAPVHRSGTAVGIDMGVVRLATLSDGTFYGPRNSFRQHQAGLRKA